MDWESYLKILNRKVILKHVFMKSQLKYGLGKLFKNIKQKSYSKTCIYEKLAKIWIGKVI